LGSEICMGVLRVTSLAINKDSPIHVEQGSVKYKTMARK
jgi:hypothetical protein